MDSPLDRPMTGWFDCRSCPISLHLLYRIEKGATLLDCGSSEPYYFIVWIHFNTGMDENVMTVILVLKGGKQGSS